MDKTEMMKQYEADMWQAYALGVTYLDRRSK